MVDCPRVVAGPVLLLMLLAAACSSQKAAAQPANTTVPVSMAQPPQALVNSEATGPADDPADTAIPAQATDEALPMRVMRQSRFAWPALGPLTSYFGYGHLEGIDIGL